MIYRVKWAFLKLLGKLRELWEIGEVTREGFGGNGNGSSGVNGLVNWGVFGK